LPVRVSGFAGYEPEGTRFGSSLDHPTIRDSTCFMVSRRAA